LEGKTQDCRDNTRRDEEARYFASKNRRPYSIESNKNRLTRQQGCGLEVDSHFPFFFEGCSPQKEIKRTREQPGADKPEDACGDELYVFDKSYCFRADNSFEDRFDAENK